MTTYRKEKLLRKRRRHRKEKLLRKRRRHDLSYHRPASALRHVCWPLRWLRVPLQQGPVISGQNMLRSQVTNISRSGQHVARCHTARVVRTFTVKVG